MKLARRAGSTSARVNGVLGIFVIAILHFDMTFDDVMLFGDVG